MRQQFRFTRKPVHVPPVGSDRIRKHMLPFFSDSQLQVRLLLSQERRGHFVIVNRNDSK
jgi:hypothetical protein